MGDSANYVVELFYVDLSTDNSHSKEWLWMKLLKNIGLAPNRLNRLSYFILHIAGDTFYQVSQVML